MPIFVKAMYCWLVYTSIKDNHKSKERSPSKFLLQRSNSVASQVRFYDLSHHEIQEGGHSGSAKPKEGAFWSMALWRESRERLLGLALRLFKVQIVGRLLGSFEELRIHKSWIRVRQLLKDDKWIVIGKVNLRIKLPSGNGCLPSLENSSCQDSYVVSSTSSKRACPYTEEYPRKMRAIEKECEHQQVFYRSPSSLLKKVDNVAYPRAKLDEKYMRASFLCPTTRYFEKENIIFNGANSCCERSSEVSDCDTDAWSIESVGSCSVNGNHSSKTAGYDLAGNCEEADTLSSDADSFSSGADLVENVSLPLKHDIAATIHRLQLDAYRQTLMVMHASGSLSWEQQDLLTTLRTSLHISNDEHLMEGQGWRLLALLPKV
ncbi:hypothetical protein ACLB2K_019122 [Fragaria x ananassa]